MPTRPKTRLTLPKLSLPKREQAEAEALFMSMGDGALVTDEQGKISKINQAALDILGFTREELLGVWYPSHVIAEDEDGRVIPTLQRPITKVFLSGKSISTRLYYRRKDGSRVAVFLTVSPVMIDDQPIGAIEVFRDITRELELEQAKDEFISLASHQLRTPATGVKQYIAMLLEEYFGKMSADQRAMLQRVYDTNERQIMIINDLLRVAHLDAGKVTLQINKVDLGKLLKDIIDEQQHKFKNRNQLLHFNVAVADASVAIDPQRMRMVLENIIDNAGKYTPEGKNITVEVKRQPGYMVVAIIDEGVGIPTKEITKIFNKFSRLENPLSLEVGGTGLGLYWAKKIVDLHGGNIKVSSRLGKGSTFAILLPKTKA